MTGAGEAEPGGDRFRRLFADLEARADAEDRWAEDARVEEMTRSEVAGIRLIDRLRATASSPGVTVVVRGAGTVRGRIAEVGRDVVCLDGSDRAAWAIHVPAVIWVDGLVAGAVEPEQVPAAERLGLAAVMRRWVRDRLPVTVHLVEGGALAGTPDRAAADHLDLAEHDLDVPRRPESVRRVVAVPYAAIAAVRRR